MLGVAAAVGLIGLVAADLAPSTMAHWRKGSQVSSTVGHADSVISRPATTDILQPPVIDILPWSW